jgi:hypothetical protein
MYNCTPFNPLVLQSKITESAHQHINPVIIPLKNPPFEENKASIIAYLYGK